MDLDRTVDLVVRAGSLLARGDALNGVTMGNTMGTGFPLWFIYIVVAT